MSNGFEKLENKDVEDRKRRSKLSKKLSNVGPEAVEKADFFSNRKREEYIADNVKETPNVETDSNE